MEKVQNIPVFILAGGLGTRLSEETNLKPKPMIEVGQIPMLVHIMRWYYSFGFNDFVICAGYKSWDIKEYFLNYRFRQNHLCIDQRKNSDAPAVAEGAEPGHEKWRVRVVETGLESMTGARLARAYDFVADGQQFNHFAVTYGDGLADVDLDKELHFHLERKTIGTLLGVSPLSRFGEMQVDASGKVIEFLEKPEMKNSLINGGFFFFKSEFRKFLSPSSDCILERAPLQKLAQEKQLSVYTHRGFWQCMDTLRDKTQLQSIWDGGKAPWLPQPRT